MTTDHYATLGVAPTAPAAVIRAAYLALMREYHPDKNASPVAAARAQAIIAAFKVLGDFERRSEYDWDRRRAREAMESRSAKPRRSIGAGAIAAGAIGLAAAGALTMIPASAPEPERATAPTKMRPMPPKKMRQAPVIAAKPSRRSPQVELARPTAGPKQVEMPAVAKVEAVRLAPVASPSKPIRLAKIEPVPPRPARSRPEPLAMRRAQAPEAPSPPQKMAAGPAAPRRSKAVAPVKREPANGTDLASLDQFVMSYYGQSWRFGDRPKRAMLEQTRAGFVARKGACAADPCRREAYLKLMRDVARIVESSPAKTP